MMRNIGNGDYTTAGMGKMSSHQNEKTAETPRKLTMEDITGPKPDRISKDGDTLELSKTKISDAALKGYSEARLRSMLQNKEISRQQYDKVIKQKDGGEDFQVTT